MQGVLHIHSQYSYDGKETLSQIRDKLLVSGISFVCMTEHTDHLDSAKAETFIAECARLSDSKFVMVPGFEVPYLGTHILVVGAFSYHYDQQDSIGSFDRWLAGGALLIVAHPHRNSFHFDQYLLEKTVGMEVWNSQYDGKLAPRSASLARLRSIQKSNPNYQSFGSLDMHQFRHLGGPVLQLNLEHLESASILAQLRSGAFSIIGSRFTLSSLGEIQSGPRSLMGLLSFISCQFVRFGKLGGRGLKLLGLGRIQVLNEMKNKVRKKI